MAKRGFDSTEVWAPGSTGSRPGAGPRQGSIASDVGVPFLQSVITGGLVGAAIVAGVGALGIEFPRGIWESWALLGVLVAAGVWVWFLWGLRRILYQQLEDRLQVDIDGDGEIGTPQVQERPIFINGARVVQEQKRQVKEAENSELADFIRGLAVRGTSGDAWFKVIGRDRYHEYRALLIDNGLARWKSFQPDGKPNTNKGWELTTPVDVILRALEG